MSWDHYREAPEATTAKRELEEARAWMRSAAIKLRMLYAASGEDRTREGIHLVAQELDKAAGPGA